MSFHGREIELLPWVGEVTEMVGLLIASRGPVAPSATSARSEHHPAGNIRSQVIGFRNEQSPFMPLEETDGLQLGDRVIARKSEALLKVGPQLLGRVLDGFGGPIDGGPPIQASATIRLSQPPLSPGSRAHHRTVDYRNSRHRWIASVRQRTARGNLRRQRRRKALCWAPCRGTIDADVTVIALVENATGKYARFSKTNLVPKAGSRSVVVVATSDRPAPLRIRGLLRRAGGSRIFSRSGQERSDGAGFRYPPGHGAARNWVRCRRTAQSKRIHAFRSSRCFPRFSNAPDISRKAPLPDSSPCWWRGTISMSRFAMPFAEFSTATLFLSRELGVAGHYPALDIRHSSAAPLLARFAATDFLHPENSRGAGALSRFAGLDSVGRLRCRQQSQAGCLHPLPSGNSNFLKQDAHLFVRGNAGTPGKAGRLISGSCETAWDAHSLSLDKVLALARGSNWRPKKVRLKTGRCRSSASCKRSVPN